MSRKRDQTPQNMSRYGDMSPILSHANVTEEYEYQTIEGMKARRLGPGYDWEVWNKLTNKWVEYTG